MIFKRIISTITGAALLTSYMSILSGCSMKEFFSNESKSDPPSSSADDGTLTNAEWLGMVNDAFGMQVDENAEDGELDAAKTWGVIGEDEQIDMDAPVDDKFVTTTLMRAAGFATPDSTDEEVIQAAIEHGVLTDADASVANPEQAIQSLSKAQNEWMTQEFEEHRNIDLVDGVQNFSETMNVADFKVTDGGVVIPSEYAETLEKDSVFILPKDSATGDGGAYKVVAKVINSDGTVNVKSVPAKPEEIYENIDVSGKFYADMSNFELASDSRVTSSTGASPTGMSYRPTSFIASPLANNNDVNGGIQTMASVGVNSVDFKISLDDKTKLGLSVKDIALNTDIDWSFGVFKGLTLDRIYMAVDYTTEISVERTLGEAGDDGIELYKKLLEKDYLSEPSIELGKAAVYICPGISINLRFAVTFEASGKISVSVSTANTKGFELVGSDFRSINKTTKSAEISLTGEAGLYANLTLALSLDYVVGEVDLLSLKLKTGPTLKGEAKLHAEDNKDPLFCIDVSGTLKVEVKLVLLEKVMKAFGLEASLTLVDEDLGGWNLHLENFKKVPSCTFGEDDDKQDTTEADTIPVGIFALDTSYLSLDVGSSGKISVKSLPSGYSASDLKWSSSNPSIVSVDANGNIYAASAGTVSITVKTSDGKYSVQCAVMSKANITISDIGNDNDYTGAMAA